MISEKSDHKDSLDELKSLHTAGHKVWDFGEIDIPLIMSRLMDMTNSIVWQHTQNTLINIQEGNKADEICCIEIGAGLGKLSCLIGLSGVAITLLDSSQAALRSAEALGKQLGLHQKLIFADALSIPEEFWGKYDLAVSLGVNEHFLGKARKQIFNANYQVLKPGGWALISVPNSMCIPYRLAIGIYKLTNRWPNDLIEKPFTKKELEARMIHSGFKEVKVWSGSKRQDDFRFFVISNLKALLRKISGKPSKSTNNSLITVKELRNAVCKEKVYSPFVCSQSYSLLAVGQRH